jgi:glycosyltransferase involved in cell wall biosynthesis
LFAKKTAAKVYHWFWTHDRRASIMRTIHGYHARNWVERRRNRAKLQKLRHTSNLKFEDDILVSVIIPTYNRSKVLIERAIPSVLSQTYRNFELIIVGDHCTDNTRQLVESFNDSRIKFFNLPERGKYPRGKWDRWMVAGTVPRNKGLEIASGDWIAPLDDDDEFSNDHLELLLHYALQNQFDMVYGILQMELEFGKWVECGSYPLRYKHICHSAVLYNSSLKFLKYNVNAWKYVEPDDWNLWRRIEEAGAKIGFLNEVVGKHHQEHLQFNV